MENILTKYNVSGVWTSGRLCNFHGCDVSGACCHLPPDLLCSRLLTSNLNISMAGSGQARGPGYLQLTGPLRAGPTTPGPTQVRQCPVSASPPPSSGYLSQFVSHDVPQPDNAEYLLHRSGVTVEACLAVLNSWYNDGVEWHDSACYRTKMWICEVIRPLTIFP